MTIGIELTEEQSAIKHAIEAICAKYDDHYWLKVDTTGEFPNAFVDDIAAGGWLGVAMPESVGGAGLGLTEAALMMQAVAQSGAGFSGASAIHLNVFGLMPIVKFGTPEQQQMFLPPVISGRGQDLLCRHGAEFWSGHIEPRDESRTHQFAAIASPAARFGRPTRSARTRC